MLSRTLQALSCAMSSCQSFPPKAQDAVLYCASSQIAPTHCRQRNSWQEKRTSLPFLPLLAPGFLPQA